MLWDLIRRIEDVANRDDMAQIVMKLQEIGFLQFETEIPETGVAYRHYRIPTPSLLTWIIDTATLSDDDHAISAELQREYGAIVDAFYERHGIAM